MKPLIASISFTDAPKLKSFLGIPSGGRMRQRLFFDDFYEFELGVGVETKKPFFSCLYTPVEVLVRGENKKVWVENASFKRRFNNSPEQVKLFFKLTQRIAPVRIPFLQQSPEKYQPHTLALWTRMREFTPNPPLLSEIDRITRFAVAPTLVGQKIERGDRGRSMIVAPNGKTFILMTRSESEEDPVSGSGTYKKIKVAIDRATFEERVVATGKKKKTPEYLKEIQILEKLKGEEEFVQIETWAETNSKFYILMEKCNGGNLWQRLRENSKPLTDAQRWTLALDYLRGVQKLHQKNIIHRDLKPQNLLLSEKGDQLRGKICDFGDAADGDSKYGSGTPIFSWDPHSSLRRNPDKKVDIWALGTILYLLFHPTHRNLPYQDQEQFTNIVRALSNLTQEEINRSIETSGIANPRVLKALKGMLVIDRTKRFTADQALAVLHEKIRPEPKRTWVLFPHWAKKLYSLFRSCF